MKMIKISKNSVKPAVWDGGKTFEYFIYPENTSYTKRDFTFRISAASIEKTPSLFTRFENYQRFLVMLDNDLSIERNNLKESYSQHQVFNFDSNDNILSNSLGNDFNLMVCKNKAQADVLFAKGVFQQSNEFIFFYVVNDTKILIKKTLVNLQQNDLLIIENLSKEEVSFEINEDCILGFIELL